MRNKRHFERIVRKTQPELKDWLLTQLIEQGYTEPIVEDGFLYAPGTVPVMLLAHLDTVHKQPVKEICWDKDYNVAMSPQGIGGDDRCGVYMILRIVKELNCHVLFCEDEECGGVGAYTFANSGLHPKVNYLIEFDRKGSNDAVFYDCANPDFITLLKRYGFKESYGTFSDISAVAPALGVAAVNVSSGYYNQHTLHESVNIQEMNTNADRIARLIRENADTYYEYIEDKTYRGYGLDWMRGYYRSYDYDNYCPGSYWNSAASTGSRTLLMPLNKVGHELTVYSEDGGDYLVGVAESHSFAIDKDENLYLHDKDDVWNYLETPYGVYDEEEGEYVEFRIDRARYATIDWSPKGGGGKPKEEDPEDDDWEEDIGEEPQGRPMPDSVPADWSTIQLMMMPKGTRLRSLYGREWMPLDSDQWLDKDGNLYSVGDGSSHGWIWMDTVTHVDGQPFAFDESRAVPCVLTNNHEDQERYRAYNLDDLKEWEQWHDRWLRAQEKKTAKEVSA